MALVYFKLVENGKTKENFMINTNNIKTIIRFEGVNISGFEVCLMSGLALGFNQIYYQGNFIYVHTMEQLYSLLTKLDSGVIQDGSA